MSSHDEKAEVAHDDSGGEKITAAPDYHHSEHGRMKAEIERIDAIALAPGTTIDSFSHLDEKKILRKV